MASAMPDFRNIAVQYHIILLDDRGSCLMRAVLGSAVVETQTQLAVGLRG